MGDPIGNLRFRGMGNPVSEGKRNEAMATRASRAEALYGRGGNGPAAFEGRVRRWIREELPSSGTFPAKKYRWKPSESTENGGDDEGMQPKRYQKWEPLPLIPRVAPEGTEKEAAELVPPIAPPADPMVQPTA